MNHCLRLFCLTVAFVGSLLLPNLSYGQIFYGEQQKTVSTHIGNQISHWEVYRVDASGLYNVVKDNPDAAVTQLHLGQHHWRLDLTPNPIISPDYTLQVLTPNGLEVYPLNEPRAFRGYDLAGGGRVRLTLNKDLIYGFVEEGGERFYIEPLWYYDPSADRKLFILYNSKDVNRNIPGSCAVVEGEEKLQHLEGSGHATEGSLADNQACYQVDLAIASDNSMRVKYGSAQGAQDHNIGVINDVEVDYTGSFNHDIAFNIVTQFVSSGTDPWTNSTAPGTLLASFRTWGNAGNFGVVFDIGELWTNRDFDDNVIGIAYLNGVCNSNKYHCLQDFTGNGELLRCMTSHEIGHNFSCVHDGGSPCGWIMCPSVSFTTSWSSQSVNSVNGFITPLINNGCLSPCGPPPAPLIADFEWDPNPGCAGQPVHFTDLSSGNITGRTWTFTGATPPTSTLTNPTATWSVGGTFNVKLTLTGTGGPVSTTKQITIQPLAVANFTYSVNGLTLNFTSTSTNATTYDWDFGDGTGSTEANPSHTYNDAGVYTVKLTVSNDCGSSTKMAVINTAPLADFSANQTSGCAPLTVQFTNESSANAATFVWQFPGGAPAQSSLTNPTVVYTTSGTYTVTLTATNGAGSNTVVKTNYITVQNLPSSTFTSSVNGLTVTFTNTSVNATTSNWNFGDGGTSTQTNPTHTYATGGTYTVTLSSGNACGTVTNTQTVTLTSAPTAAFTATPTSGCGPLTVQFTNQSTGGATAFNWQFPGGTPSSSTAQNPTVVYNAAGTYSVTLTATNGAGANTATQSNYITVYSGPTAGFSSAVNGSTATFTNSTATGTAPGATTYSWNFGDSGTSTAANPTHTYNADGTYTVVLTASNGCGTSTSTHTVVIATPPTANFTATNTSGCAPLTVQFTSTSSANAQTFNWQFPGGNPSSSTAQNPTVVYNTAGTYSVTLTVSNGAGSNTATQTNLVTVSTTPTTAFTSSVAGATATFTNGTTGATTYSWNFGDNTNSTAANPTHTYTADGTYTVVLTATNACGSTSFTQTVVIATPPTANFTATNTSGCAPLTVQFTSTSSANAQTFNWQFPGGNPSTSTAQNPTVVYNTAGTYSVTLTVSNGAGSNTATQTSLVTVSAAPTAAFSSTVTGATATFTNASSLNAGSFAWNFGDGNASNQANPAHTYTADGTYTVTLTATNICGSATFTQNVVIITSPSAGFTASTTTGCADLTVHFTDLSSGNTTGWNWTFPGGTPSSSTEQNPTVVYSTPGTYDVTLVASTGAGSSTFTQPGFITVLGTPTAGFSSSNNGTTVTFTNTSANGTSYFWNFGDGSTSTEENPTHHYTDDGNYPVTLTVTNNCGSTTYTFGTDVSSAPTASFTADATMGCVPFDVQFTSTSSANTTSYSWVFEGGTPANSALPNPMVSWSQPGTYNVTLVAANGAGSDIATTTITVAALPAAAFSMQPTGLSVAFTNTSANGTSYEWKFGDGDASTDANPTHVYAQAGTYTVELTVSNACGAATLQQTITVTTTGTQEAGWLSEFRVYPNPNPGRFVVEMQGPSRQEVEFTLFNAVGQLVHREVADFGTGNLRQVLDCSALPSALYSLRIRAGGQSVFVKIAVQQ